jgi:hypothetical protein
MSQVSLLQLQSHRITDAIKRAYQVAGLTEPSVRPGAARYIVPLYELMGAYPLRVAEVRNLTYGSARDFLVAETRQELPVPENSDCSLAGFLYIYRYAGLFYGCVLLEQRDPVARRRFTAAHELGHYLLHFLPLLQDATGEEAGPCIITEGLAALEDPDAGLPEGEVRFSDPFALAAVEPAIDRETMEDEANAFAAELLMPETSVKSLAERYRRETGGRRSVLARRLAPEFLVSRQAMLRRLQTLGLPAAAREPDARVTGSTGE